MGSFLRLGAKKQEKQIFIFFLFLRLSSTSKQVVNITTVWLEDVEEEEEEEG